MNKKEKIIETALKLFVDNGFHGTATSKIAHEAGVANGTLFNYFKTKDELVIAIYVAVKEDMAAFITKNTAKSNSFKEVMKSQFLSSLFWALDNQQKFHFIQQFHTSPYIEKVEQEIIQSQVLPHLLLIQSGIDKGLLKKLPVDFVYAIISSQTFGLYQYLISKKLSRVQQHDTIEQTFELLWDMIT
ncbi:MAG TPA: TetR/AcrR family transcriptional regulator [Flavobacterium sp.]|jgi:AcrR family transcriptional regulator